MTFPILAASSPTGYNIDKSLRFRASASAYLNRTLSASNRKTWTWSGWVKRGKLGSIQYLLASPATGTTGIRFNSADTFYFTGNSTLQFEFTTTQVFRDPSAWYHFVVAFDSTQATASNRVKIYVNGQQITAFAIASYPSLNLDGQINDALPHTIGLTNSDPATAFDGYLAEVNFIDGQALTPSSFGSFNALTGVWQPARYTGTYGTNGFYLDFETTTSVAALGNDKSGNGNTWTVNNISLTAGVTYDSMTDVCTLTNATTANYAVLNPLTKAPNSTLTDANLLIANNTTSIENIRSTMTTCATLSYWEFVATTVTSSVRIQFGGILSANAQSVPNNVDIAVAGPTGTFGGLFDSGMKFSVNGTQVGSTYGSTTLTGLEIIMFAHDSSTGKVWMGLNGVWYNSGNPAAGTGQVATLTAGTVFPTIMVNGSAGNNRVTANFGQRPFTYTPPTGFLALNAFNLPTATILKGNTVMDATLYTGTAAAQTIANAAAFYPDLVWAKQRSGANNNIWVDSNRGATNFLVSNTNGAEATNSAVVSAIGSSGFTLGTDGTINGSGQTNVAWQWNAGSGSTSSNTNGSITSTVSANAAAGFSIAKFTTQASGVGTFGHGLGVAPAFYMVTSRSAVSGRNTYHKSIGATQYMQMNTTAAAVTDSSLWNNTSPTSSLITIGTAFAGGSTAICYAWSEIDGFSKFGSYVGNSNVDGPFIYCGFRPKFVLFKGSSFANNWYIIDSTTNTINVAGAGLIPNANSAETATSTTENAVDFLSNGFKLRNNASAVAFNNSSGQTFIYAAYAENPTKYALAR